MSGGSWGLCDGWIEKGAGCGDSTVEDLSPRQAGKACGRKQADGCGDSRSERASRGRGGG